MIILLFCSWNGFQDLNLETLEMLNDNCFENAWAADSLTALQMPKLLSHKYPATGVTSTL